VKREFNAEANRLAQLALRKAVVSGQ
jgi:hypothetical protein